MTQTWGTPVGLKKEEISEGYKPSKGERISIAWHEVFMPRHEMRWDCGFAEVLIVEESKKAYNENDNVKLLYVKVRCECEPGLTNTLAAVDYEAHVEILKEEMSPIVITMKILIGVAIVIISAALGLAIVMGMWEFHRFVTVTGGWGGALGLLIPIAAIVMIIIVLFGIPRLRKKKK